MSASVYVPLEILRKLPYESRYPMDEMDNIGIFVKDFGFPIDDAYIWKFGDTVAE